KPIRRPTRRRTPAASDDGTIPNTDPSELFEELVLAPDSVSREGVIRLYDHEVQGRTVVKSLHGRVVSPSHGDAAVLRPRPESWRGLAVTVAAQPWTCRASPRAGAIWTVEEAARNLYAVGARPDAFTNCLNFGNPEDPTVLGDLAEVTRGLADGARALDMMVPSGNVSLYNGGLGAGIPPTPVLMATGLVPDLRHAVTSDLKAEGDPLYLLGTSRPELGGSLWARMHGRTDLPVPLMSPALTHRLGEKLLDVGSRGDLAAVHDVSDGGLAVTLAEMAFGGGFGFSVDLAASALDAGAQALAVEGASRWVVEVAPASAKRFETAVRGLPCVRLGDVTARDGRLRWGDQPIGTVGLDRLYALWRPGLGVP
ncbi:MAG: AIR synthase-related protein, partial [Thermoplasmata archaeon]|nr:AIR synthase-related protein [Thermoplasmata archaeon]